ncbi:MAG: hypothetical protein ACJ73D_02515 [Pyrinomonadaceae bacterium]
MNSEALERSLRDEFENYLKGVIAELKQETAEFQQRVASEFDRQRQAMDEALASLTARFDSENKFDEAFIASVGEHLRLARDEGAKITATAFAEAEKLQDEAAAQQPVNYDAIRDAVNDISGKDSQSSILKALVTHAAGFAPRGAFFIIKNEHLAGWKVFGDANDHAAQAVREVHFPIADQSILSAAINSTNTVESSAGVHPADSSFLEPLGFGHPDRMYAIPLTARGRAVAVLYADYGNDGTHLSREALETLVRVAGLTVELLAANGSAAAPAQVQPSQEPAPAPEPQPTQQEVPESAQSLDQPAQDFSFNESVSYQGGFPEAEVASEPERSFGTKQPEPEYQQPTPNYQPEPPAHAPANGYDAGEGTANFVTERADETAEFPEFHEATPFVQPAEEPAQETQPVPQFEPKPSFQPVAEFQAAPATPSPAFEPAVVSPTVQAPEKSVVPVGGSRYSDRNVDLPIQVPEEERRSHNDARRFARLLVSEIKLYNEKKVLEGREHRDIYERLREAIDRSREMYEKRVQPPVAARFDYFHYELINALADGDATRLGSGYPGPTVS